MKVITKKISIESTGKDHIIDITGQTKEELRKSHLKIGIVTIFVPSSTAAITTIESEP